MGSRSLEIAKRMPPGPLLGAEVGVRYGKNAKNLLEALPELKLYLVDTWSKPPEGDSYYDSGDGVAQRPEGYWKKCFPQFKERMEPYTNRIHVMRMFSNEAAKHIQKDYGTHIFDFVFLDADHSYKGVAKDIKAWLPLVKHGGYLCGHDYNHPRIGNVKKAVDDFFGSKAEAADDMTWFYKT